MLQQTKKVGVPIAAAMLDVSFMLEQINTTSEHTRQLLIWQMGYFPSLSEKRIGNSCTHLNRQQYLFVACSRALGEKIDHGASNDHVSRTAHHDLSSVRLMK